MKLFLPSLQRRVLACWHLMLSQAATLCLRLAEEEKIAWETWKVFPEVSDAFLEMSNILGKEMSDTCIIQLERFVLMYDRTSE